VLRETTDPRVKIAHVVRSDAFAGVERYICLVAPRLAASGCEVSVIGGDPTNMHHISETVNVRPASSTFGAVSELLRLGRLDIVHAHMTAAELAAVLTRHRNHAQLVATLHFALPRGSGKVGSPLPLLGRFIDEQIAISQFVANSVAVSRVLLNGVEVADPGPSKRDRTVLVMQRLEAEKRTDVALHAWSASNLRKNGWRLSIAGQGSELARLRSIAKYLDLEPSIDWRGFVSDPSDLLSRAGLLLATAPAEPFGLTVVEAMARATPVIAADGGAHRETIGCDGWFFPVDDVAACARMLDESEHRDLADYGRALRIRQHHYFDISAHTDALLQIYRELVR
jgi:glycosyltransferase involved in cell wall biosynthesis